MNIRSAQEQIWKRLLGALKKNHLAHSFAFISEDGAGKEDLAREFIKFQICENPVEDSPCEVCRNCNRINHNTHCDVHIFEPLPEKRDLTIEVIENIQDTLRYRALETAGKFIIVRKADKMNIPAANRFLKTLEEPPDNTMIFLLASQFDTLLPTIRSRCQPVHLKPLSHQHLVDFATREFEVELTKNSIDHLVAIADSSPGLLRELLEENFINVYQLMRNHIFVEKRKTPFPASDEIMKLLSHSSDKTQEPTRKRLKSAVRLMLVWFRDELFRSLSSELNLLDKTIPHQKKLISPDLILAEIDRLYELNEFINRNLNLRLMAQELMNIAVSLN